MDRTHRHQEIMQTSQRSETQTKNLAVQQAAVLTALPLCLGTRSQHHRTFTLNKLICLSPHRIEKLVGRVTMF